MRQVALTLALGLAATSSFAATVPTRALHEYWALGQMVHALSTDFYQILSYDTDVTETSDGTDLDTVVRYHLVACPAETLEFRKHSYCAADPAVESCVEMAPQIGFCR